MPQVSVAAFEQAADPEALREFGPPWQVQKLYYHLSGNRERFVALDAAMIARGREPAVRRAGSSAGRPTDRRGRIRSPGCPVRSTSRSATRPCWPTPPRSIRTGHWFSVPLEVHQQAWPTEDFELVTSHVETSSRPEDDLFAGIAVPADDARRE